MNTQQANAIGKQFALILKEIDELKRRIGKLEKQISSMKASAGEDGVK